MGGSHGHAHGTDGTRAPESRRTRRLALLVVVPLAVLTLVALAVLWPRDAVPDSGGQAAQELDATVTAIAREACPAELDDDVNGCGTATIELAEQPAQGEREVEVPLPNGSGAPELDEGDAVVVTVADTPDGPAYSVVDHQRSTGLLVVAVAFALAMVAFGRWRGLAALVGLVVTFGVLLLFVVPAILTGSPPLLVAVVGAAAIALSVLYLTHGFTLTTTVALLGTLVSLALTGALAAGVTAALHLTGVTDDISGSVDMTYDVDMAGLLVASIIIGSLGVLDDVTVTQAETVAELAAADPSSGFGRLYRSASRVGRAHIASVVNTIVLAYAGSSLPLLLLIAADNDSFVGVVSTQLVAQEVVRSIVATLGLVAAVPLATALPAAAA
ncbi:YibE/F family protein, partial [Nocardioides lentus]|uniref:YibE/F family protein n=1 Tax=Nocardioides lentus TaxID=338077 RepID=UPI0031D25245